MPTIEMKNRPKLLVMGGTGFVGGYLCQYLQADYEVFCPPPSVDVRDREAVAETVASIKPNRVVNLAAVSNVPDSFADPFQTFDVNLMGNLNLLVALDKSDFRGTMLYVSSSQVYGDQAVPFVENMLPKPVNPYAASKLGSEALCTQWNLKGPFSIIIARPFNHIGVGQADHFLVPHLAKQIVAIKKGKLEPRLQVGNTHTTRDFTDVRDVVCAYKLLLEKGRSGEIYNVCSARETSVKDLIELLLAVSGVRAEVESVESRMRTHDQPRMCGSYGKILEHTGWKPRVSLRESLVDIVQYFEKAS